jgi:hypothetical protein
MRKAKMLAKDALARRSVGVMSKESEESECEASTTKKIPKAGPTKTWIVPD